MIFSSRGNLRNGRTTTRCRAEIQIRGVKTMSKTRFTVVLCLATVILVSSSVQANVLRRVRRQSDGDGPAVIDHILNIPITAIKGTATAAQGFYPDYSDNISNVFQVPISALEAVGTLVKSTRRSQEDMEAAMKRRKAKKDRLIARRQANRDRYSKVLQHHRDPFGLDALTDLLVGNHGVFDHDKWCGHLGFLGSLVGHGSGSNQGSQGGSASAGSDTDLIDEVDEIDNNENTYEVTENPEENRSGWNSWLNFGNFFGGSTVPSSSSGNRNREKTRPDRRKYGRYDEQDAPLENKIAPKNDRRNGRRGFAEPPLENKIAPRNDARNYRREQHRSRPEGRSRITFDDNRY